MILFTSIFSTISIIEDRREGFLQAVLAAPISRSAIVLGKILGGATLATLQGLVLCLLAPFAGLHVDAVALLVAVVAMFATGAALTALSFLVAWPMQSVQGFHAIMNLFLMPLWLLSGALFPPSGAAPWLRVIMEVNPLHYGLVALRRAFYVESHPLLTNQPSLAYCLILLTLVTGLLLYLGVLITRGNPGRNP